MEPLLRTPELQLYMDQIPRDWPQEAFLLSEREMAYCLQSRNTELQLSRAKLRLMVKQILNDPQIEVTSGELGRPRVHPQWDISFSHKGTKALVGLVSSPDRLGVDIEDFQQRVDWSVFAGHCFLEQEQESLIKLSQVPGWNQHRAKLGFFSLKEAFFKVVDKPFTPADLLLNFRYIEKEIAYFEAYHKGQKQIGLKCYILMTTDELISVCHLRACL